MSEQNNNRTRWLHMRLKPDEYNKIYSYFSKTTCRKLSDYARRVLLNKPVTGTLRNQSLDDLMTELMKLRGELNIIGNNFNQAVKKLHTLHQISEFRLWLMTYEMDEKRLLDKVDEIKNHIEKMAEKWLQ